MPEHARRPKACDKDAQTLDILGNARIIGTRGLRIEPAVCTATHTERNMQVEGLNNPALSRKGSTRGLVALPSRHARHGHPRLLQAVLAHGGTHVIDQR